MTKAQEEAVSNYLTAVNYPDRLKDDKRLKELQKASEATTDVLEEAKLVAEYDRLDNIKPENFEQGLIEHGKAWADANDVTAKVLHVMGVSDDVLIKAGFEITRSRPKAAQPKQGSKRVSRDHVVEVVKGQGEPFVLSTIADVSGASLATVRKVVGSLEESGDVKNLGDDPNHTGRGASPKLYQVVNQS